MAEAASKEGTIYFNKVRINDGYIFIIIITTLINKPFLSVLEILLFQEYKA